MISSIKMETIYVDGDPNGIRKITLHLSPMVTYVVPREKLSEAKRINGIDKQGVYYLFGNNSIYIGQTRNGINRLDDHNRQKDFWNIAILFLSDSKTFSLDMISGLEEYAISKAAENKNIKLINTVNPKYKIDEFDYPSIIEIYDKISFIISTQNFAPLNNKDNSITYYHNVRKTADSFLSYENKKFIVKKGSKLTKNISPSLSKFPSIYLLRNEMIEHNKLIDDGSYLVLQEDVLFESPSAAAVFVYGSSANGWTEWRLDNGKSLDDMLRKSKKNM